MWLCWSKHLLCTCVHLSTQMHRKWSLKASSYSTVHKCGNKWPPHECRSAGQKVMSVSAHVDLRCTPNKPPVKQNDEKNDSDWKVLSHTHVAHHQQVTLLSWYALRPNPEQAGRGEIGLVYYPLRPVGGMPGLAESAAATAATAESLENVEGTWCSCRHRNRHSGLAHRGTGGKPRCRCSVTNSSTHRVLGSLSISVVHTFFSLSLSFVA